MRERDVDLLWVNNFNRIKRPDRFLELARSMPAKRSHMIGGPQTGFDWLFDETASIAAEIPSLTFHGPVPYHDVNDFYERAKVFVNTSDSEGFPNSYLQAWVRGTPVIAFFDPDDIISREGLGAAVQTNAEMQDAVERLSSDAALWNDTSQRCLAYMRRKYDDEAILAPYLEAFQGPYRPRNG